MNYNKHDKNELLASGMSLVNQFCTLNDLPHPSFKIIRDGAEWPFSVCAYYREKEGIVICLPKCGSVGYGGPAWSCPGYIIDRTPYGVVAHELGHHVDLFKASSADERDAYSSDFSFKMLTEADEPGVTNYANENHMEWFAEAFRLFVTNPDLLKCFRPRTYEAMSKHFKRVIKVSWLEVLVFNNAPDRTRNQAFKKIRGKS